MMKLVLVIVTVVAVGGILPMGQGGTSLGPPNAQAMLDSCAESSANPYDLFKKMQCLIDIVTELWRNGDDGSAWW